MLQLTNRVSKILLKNNKKVFDKILQYYRKNFKNSSLGLNSPFGPKGLIALAIFKTCKFLIFTSSLRLTQQIKDTPKSITVFRNGEVSSFSNTFVYSIILTSLVEIVKSLIVLLKRRWQIWVKVTNTM